MAMFVTGDIHGLPQERFSFKTHPDLRELTKDDVMIILGDVGLPFGLNAPWSIESDIYNLRWLNNKPWKTICICGNHDDRDAISKMPIVEKWNGQVRQAMVYGTVYKNVFYVDCPQVLDIQEQHCLIIPGAESHDIKDGILDPEDDDFEYRYKRMKKDPNKLFRIKGWSWWEDEAVDIETTKIVLNEHKNEFFDYIFTHDAPANINEWFGRYGFREISTEGQLFLENLRETLAFDSWFHGHYHTNQEYPTDERIMCLYNWILECPTWSLEDIDKKTQ